MITAKILNSVGFLFSEKENNKDVFINECVLSRDEKIHLGETYQDKTHVVIENNCGQFYFMGWLKNKRELKKLLEQVGVNYVVA